MTEPDPRRERHLFSGTCTHTWAELQAGADLDCPVCLDDLDFDDGTWVKPGYVQQSDGTWVRPLEPWDEP